MCSRKNVVESRKAAVASTMPATISRWNAREFTTAMRGCRWVGDAAEFAVERARWSVTRPPDGVAAPVFETVVISSAASTTARNEGSPTIPREISRNESGKCSGNAMRTKLL